VGSEETDDGCAVPQPQEHSTAVEIRTCHPSGTGPIAMCAYNVRHDTMGTLEPLKHEGLILLPSGRKGAPVSHEEPVRCQTSYSKSSTSLPLPVRLSHNTKTRYLLPLHYTYH
jgi:hypothetical protein